MSANENSYQVVWKREDEGNNKVVLNRNARTAPIVIFFTNLAPNIRRELSQSAS